MYLNRLFESEWYEVSLQQKNCRALDSLFTFLIGLVHSATKYETCRICILSSLYIEITPLVVTEYLRKIGGRMIWMAQRICENSESPN